MRLKWAEQILFRSFEDRTARVRENMRQNDNEIKALTEQLDAELSRLNNHRMLLEYYDSFSAEKTVEFLKTHPMIESFDSPSGQSLVVRTQEIHVEHPVNGNVHNLGVFRIKLKMDPLQVHIMGETSILIANQKWYAPQLMSIDDTFVVMHNTTPELDQALIEVCSEHNIPGLLDLVIQWLEDVEAYHNNLGYWPVVA